MKQKPKKIKLKKNSKATYQKVLELRAINLLDAKQLQLKNRLVSNTTHDNKTL